MKKRINSFFYHIVMRILCKLVKTNKKESKSKRVGRFFVNKEYLITDKELVDKVLSKVEITDRFADGSVMVYTGISPLFDEVECLIKFEYYLVRLDENDIRFEKATNFRQVSDESFKRKGKFKEFSISK